MKQFYKIHEKIQNIVILEDETNTTHQLISWRHFLNLKTKTSEVIVDEMISSLTLDQTAVMIYTVMGPDEPRGVLLSHRNLAFTSKTISKSTPISQKSIILSYLPLSHIAEQIFSI